MQIPTADHRISVGMLTHNRREEVLRSLEQLEALPERPRIVLVDNASIDGTCQAVGARHPSVEIIQSGGNLGAAGRNLALRALDTPYVALCDDDTWWEPGGLPRAGDLLDAQPRLGLISARVLVGRENILDPTCDAMSRSPLPRQDGMPGPPLLGFLAGASVVRRQAVLDCGGFSERLFLGGEEQWLAAELATRGWWMCYVPELVVHHHPSPCRDARRRRWHEVRNALWFAWLRRPLISACRRTIELAGSRSASDVARGFLAALAGWPRMVGHRRVVPPAIEASLRRLDVWEAAERRVNHSPTFAMATNDGLRNASLGVRSDERLTAAEPLAS
jgi:GT2 family glycosyltransferase